MKHINIEILNEIIETHPQFKNKSLAFDGVVKVLGCDIDRAKELVSTHCNLISLYAIISASGTMFGSYADYFKWMTGKGFSDIHGYIKSEKAKIYSEIGLSRTLEKYKELEDIINPIRLDSSKFYQIKIKGNTSGFHFMAGYIEDGIFKLSDTSYRGVGVKASDHITDKNFCWITEY